MCTCPPVSVSSTGENRVRRGLIEGDRFGVSVTLRRLRVPYFVLSLFFVHL